MERKDFLYTYAQGLPYTELEIFTNTVMMNFLKSVEWVENAKSFCQHCALNTFGFSEEKCADNIQEGGFCIRETLRNVMMPVVRRMLEGEYPSPGELYGTIHRRGPIHDGIGNCSLRELIAHYIGGNWQHIQSNDQEEAQRVRQEAIEDYEKNWKVIFEEESSIIQ